jgi:superfamily II DNA or RNA helicase
MPKSLLAKNRDELLRFTSLSADQVAVVNGTPKQREAIYSTQSVRVFLMGFDCFAKEWKQLPDSFNAVVVDEFHMGFKTDSSKRTQSFYSAMRKATYFLGMTGTLIDGRLSSAYPAIRVIEPRYYPSYQAFIHQHGVVDDFGTVIKWVNHAKIRNILSRIAVKMSFSEAYKNSPKPVIIPEKCEMDKAHRNLYNEFEQNALLELEDKFLTDSGSGGVHQLRCRQIIEAPESVGLNQKFTLGKDEMLRVHLEDAKNNGKPLLIFSCFVAEQERLAKICSEEYGFRTALINGSVSGKKRAEIDNDFRTGKLDIVIGSPETMAVGFNWEHVDTVIFVSIDYKDSNWRQAIGRADRGTRQYPLRVYRLFYDCKVEHRLWNIIKDKQDSSNKVGY